MRFEILHRLNLAIRGNLAADGTALDKRSMHLQNLTARKQRNEDGGSDYSRGDPTKSPPWRRVRIVIRSQPVFFQGAAGTSVSSNLPSPGGHKNTDAHLPRAWLDAGGLGRDAWASASRGRRQLGRMCQAGDGQGAGFVACAMPLQ